MGGEREEAGGREGTGGAHFSIDFPLIMENQWKAYINKSRQTKRKYFFASGENFLVLELLGSKD